MSSQSETAALYARLDEVLGTESAAILMGRLPESDQVATRSDLSELEERLGHRFEQIDTRFEQIDTRFEQIDTRFEQIDTRFEKVDDRLYEFHETLRGYARTFLVVQTATVFGVAGIVLGIAQLM